TGGGGGPVGRARPTGEGEGPPARAAGRGRQRVRGRRLARGPLVRNGRRPAGGVRTVRSEPAVAAIAERNTVAVVVGAVAADDDPRDQPADRGGGAGGDRQRHGPVR